MTIQAEVFDATSFLPTSGGTLGVTFLGQSVQSISVQIQGGTVLLQIIAPAAELRVERTTAGLELSWSPSAAEHRLQSVGELGVANQWTWWPEAPVAEADRWVVRVPLATTAPDQQFFRLKKE